jgi:hypothetical protein
MNMMLQIVVAIILAWLIGIYARPSAAIAAGSNEQQSRMDKATEAVQKELQASRLPKSPVSSDESIVAMPATPDEVILNDPVTRQRYLIAMQKYYDYRGEGYAYRGRVFEWQLITSRLIFMTVLLLVGCGIYFAAVQFHTALRTVRHGTEHTLLPEDKSGDQLGLSTQLELSTKGIVVNSSVLGVIILALSLAFFYLYLMFVYPIHNVF